MASRKKRLSIGCLVFLLIIAIAAFLGYRWFKGELAPMPKGKSFYVRWRFKQSFEKALADLEKHGVVRNAQALGWYASWKHESITVPIGTYQFHPGMGADQVIKALHSAIEQMVRIPETNFSYRTANLLQRKGVLDATEYKAMIKDPTQFKADVSYPLPATSLEGYLYPDTYDLPPLMGAHDTIDRQLQAFGEKIAPLLMKKSKNWNKTLTIASMVELEAAKDKDRPLIAGVIVNRIKLKMPLQIDATVLYALQQWRRLTFADYRNTISPYNTYLNPGLPPGPICSPSLKSVLAAMSPAHHEYLYYVAMPTGYHMFAKTYPEHLANIAKRRAAMSHKK
jgi:UPF0755 protein